MLDINIIRNDIERVKQAIVNKNETTSLDSFQELDSRRKTLLIECDELRNKRNVTSKEISELRSKKKDASELIQEMKGVSDQIKQLEAEAKVLSDDLDSLLMRIPNIPSDDVPVGKDPKSNGIVNMEFPHLLQLIKHKQFDTIYHEHFSYFSLNTIKKILEKSKLEIFDVEELNLETGIVIGDLPESACDPLVNLNTNDLMFCFNGARMNPATFFHRRDCLVGTVLRDRDKLSFSASFLLQGTEFSTVTEADAVGKKFNQKITNEEIFNDDTILLYTCEGNLFKIGNVICNAGNRIMYPDCRSPHVLTNSVAFDYKLLGVDGYVGGPTCPPFCTGGL